MKRFALEFFLPPSLAALPVAISTSLAASHGGEYGPVLVFLAFFAAEFALAAIPSLVSTVLAETATSHHFAPGIGQQAGGWAIFGLLAGLVVSMTFLDGDLLLGMAAIYASAWGITGALIAVLRRHQPRHSARWKADLG